MNLAEISPPKAIGKQLFPGKVNPDMECSLKDLILFVKTYARIDISQEIKGLTEEQANIRNQELFPLVKQKGIPRGKNLYFIRDFAKEFLGIVERMLPEVGTCLFNFPRAIPTW